MGIPILRGTGFPYPGDCHTSDIGHWFAMTDGGRQGRCPLHAAMRRCFRTGAPQRGKKEKKRFLPQLQKFRRVHGLVLAGDSKVNMGAKGSFCQGGCPDGADDLSGGDAVAHLDG